MCPCACPNRAIVVDDGISLFTDASHDGYRFERELTFSSLSREHDAIGAIKHCICNNTGFGRVGLGNLVMDSSISVAVTTGFLNKLHLAIVNFCARTITRVETPCPNHLERP